MSRTITVQPSAYTDNIYQYDDGRSFEGTKLPYPFHATEDGSVLRQDFWHGRILRVVGFQQRVDVQQVDLWWEDAWKEPERAVGMYVITEDKDGGMATHLTAVSAMTVNEDE